LAGGFFMLTDPAKTLSSVRNSCTGFNPVCLGPDQPHQTDSSSALSILLGVGITAVVVAVLVTSGWLFYRIYRTEKSTAKIL